MSACTAKTDIFKLSDIYTDLCAQSDLLGDTGFRRNKKQIISLQFLLQALPLNFLEEQKILNIDFNKLHSVITDIWRGGV